MTWGKLIDFAAAFHRSRAAVVREVMRWGLKRGQRGPWSKLRHKARFILSSA